MGKLKRILPYVALVVAIILQFYIAYHNPVIIIH